jgi:hypothetical protein
MRCFSALLVLAAACASSNPNLKPNEFQTRPVSQPERMPIVTDHDDVGWIEVSSGGAFHSSLGRRRMPVLHVRVTVHNADLDAMRVPLDQLVIEGVGDGQLRPAAVFADRGQNETSVVVPSGEKRSIDLVFALPGDVSPSDVGGFQLFWGVDLPADVLRKSTAFVPTDLPSATMNVARTFRPAGTGPRVE